MGRNSYWGTVEATSLLSALNRGGPALTTQALPVSLSDTRTQAHLHKHARTHQELGRVHLTMSTLALKATKLLEIGGIFGYECKKSQQDSNNSKLVDLCQLIN